MPTAATTSVIILRRFCGPPDSGNGGYCVGVLAQSIEGVSEVTLRHPPPLEVALTLTSDGTDARLTHGDTLIGEGTAGELEIEAPAPPAYGEALRAQQGYPGFTRHIFPTCFVCGPRREPGDGLRLFSGPVDGGTLYAAPWRPGPSLAGPDEAVHPLYVWSALDCPSYFALGLNGKPALLGRMTSRMHSQAQVDEKCVVISWPVESRGRKHLAGAAVYGADERLIGVALNTWIELKTNA